MAKAIKITIDDIKEIVMESVTEIQNYQKNVQNAQNVFLKGKSGYNGITHFGVITAENPANGEVLQETRWLLDDYYANAYTSVRKIVL